MRHAVTPAAGAPAIGPYSPALRAGQFLFLSGQIPLTTAGTVVDGGIREQTAQVLENMRQLLEAGGADFASVVKTTIYRPTWPTSPWSTRSTPLALSSPTRPGPPYKSPACHATSASKSTPSPSSAE
jgi:enamine deaminase RidA (YjgF/YER057c/UK114 family)